jgi:hypothetical protein
MIQNSELFWFRSWNHLLFRLSYIWRSVTGKSYFDVPSVMEDQRLLTKILY